MVRREELVKAKLKVQAARKVKLDTAPSIRLPRPGDGWPKRLGPAMGQKAGDLGWREFEGWEAWLKLGRGWESLTCVDGGEGLRGYYLAETKDRKETGMNGEEGVDSQVVVQPGLDRGKMRQFGWHGWRELDRQVDQNQDLADK